MTLAIRLPGVALVVYLVVCASIRLPASAQNCVGDCDGSGAVTVDELVRGVNIALGNTELSTCLASDGNGNATVTVDELVTAVNHALNGCPIDPTGVLLEGPAGGNARAALYRLKPLPVPEEEIVDGLMTTRLTAVLDPDATIGEVNAVLTDAGARIISMAAGDLFVTLRIPQVTSLEEARAVAAAVSESRIFMFAYPATEAASEPLLDEDLSEGGGAELPPSGSVGLDHLVAIRMAAAWNAKGLAQRNDSPVAVLVPDEYLDTNPSPEINCQSFLETDRLSESAESGWYPGNHGFAVCGVVGANYDATPPTGTSPDPVRLLDIRSIPNRRLTEEQVMQRLVDHFPVTGRFVVNLSTTEAEGNIEFAKRDIVLNAMHWRWLMAEYADRVFVAAAAGNKGEGSDKVNDARINSAYNMAQAFDDLRQVLEPRDFTHPSDPVFVEAMWQFYTTNRPAAAHPLDNALIVGSSDASGQESNFSGKNSDVRAIGRQVFAPCQIKDPGFPGNPKSCKGHGSLCDGQTSCYTGTSFSTPQIAGLAAYLWNLDPTLSPQIVRTTLRDAYENSAKQGLVDAYLAVLSLDGAPLTMDVRREILDVAGAAPVPGQNGRFDENDLALYIYAFASYQSQRDDGASDPDYSRYDLNGDGYTGDATRTARFDLSADILLTFTTVSQQIEGATQSFDENDVTDQEILCYYAYSPLYGGDPDARRSLLSASGLCEPLDFPIWYRGRGRYKVVYHYVWYLPDRIDVSCETEVGYTVELRSSGDAWIYYGADIRLGSDPENNWYCDYSGGSIITMKGSHDFKDHFSRENDVSDCEAGENRRDKIEGDFSKDRTSGNGTLYACQNGRTMATYTMEFTDLPKWEP